jgi:hypothetical protein
VPALLPTGAMVTVTMNGLETLAPAAGEVICNSRLGAACAKAGPDASNAGANMPASAKLLPSSVLTAHFLKAIAYSYKVNFAQAKARLLRRM